MKKKYESVGLNYELISGSYPDLNEYEMIVNAYLSDPFFDEIGNMLDDEDYEMAKDALKGLYILAQDLYLYPLYIAIMDVYEDLTDELYTEAVSHHSDMMEIYKKMEGIFRV